MATNGEKKLVPPYMPYRTFSNWLAGQKAGVPARIDRSVLGNMAGVIQSQLLTTLQYLKLINSESVPSDTLASLAKAEGAERQKQLKELLRSTYSFMFPPIFNNLQNAPPRMLEEEFEKQNVTGDTVRKSLAFFLFACRDAGIQVSPHVKLARRAPRRNMVPRGKRTNAGSIPSPAGDADRTAASPAMADLLVKFPTLDPAWPDDVKAKWFESFDRLMKMVKGEK